MNSQLVLFGKDVLLVFATMLPIIDPAGTASFFLHLTTGASPEVRAALAFRVAWVGFILLVSAMFIGSHVLSFFGLSLSIVRVAGGMLVTSIGWRMLHPEATAAPEAQEWTPKLAAQRAFYPLTFPLTIGPGAIAVSITLGTSLNSPSQFDFSHFGASVVGAAALASCVFLSYRFATKLLTFLGDTGTIVFLRLSSFILLCIGIQIFWSGVSELMQPWLPHN